MAAVTSLGVHTPTALPYLIAEGILPKDPPSRLYQWETYVIEDEGDQLEEELLTTKNAVVWSQGKFVRKIYRFDLEGEDVVQALLTNFPSPSNANAKKRKSSHDGLNRARPGSSALPQPRREIEPRGSGDQRPPSSDLHLARALVVLLKTKAHICFLQGSHHIVDLPFEVERAFAAPRGLLLQRKRTSPNSMPPTPQLPPAPPNSFFSSQPHPRQSASFLDSPTLIKSFAASRPFQPSPLNGDSKLETLFNSVIAAPGTRGDDDVTNLYSLSGPLSDLGVVTLSLQHHKARVSGRTQGGLSVEFEGLDPAEKIIYFSPKEELPSQSNAGALTLLVTVNTDIHTVTLWHAWYLDEKSLRDLLKQRADHKSAKARRRSSFVSVAATGSATPAVRRRDGTRESFAGAGALPLAGEPSGSQGNGVARKHTREEEEEVMASQMDPDYLPTGAQPPIRENRRISSMNTDVRASQMTVNASFGGTGGRRATSFGGPAERRSLSRRKSRGSTPGSAYGRSIGGEDDSMDLDSTIELDDEESTDGILRHIRATFEAFGADSLFGSSDEGFKRELVVRKIHSYPIGSLASSRGPSPSAAGIHKVVTLSEAQSVHGSSDPRIKIYLHDSQSSEVQILTLKVKQRQLWPEMAGSQTVAIPLLSGEARIENCEDISKLQDGKMRAVLLGRHGIQMSLDDQVLCPIPNGLQYRAYDPLTLLSQTGNVDKDVGKNRLLDPPQGLVIMQHSGARGRFDQVGQDGVHHRRQVQLRPSQNLIDGTLSLCEVILPRYQARAVRKTWCKAHAWLNTHTDNLASTGSDIESVAAVTTIFTFVAGLIDAKARASLSISKVATGKQAPYAQLSQRHERENRMFGNSAWSWMPKQRPSTQRSPKSDANRKEQLLIVAASLADELSAAEDIKQSPSTAALSAVKLMLALHIFREEQKLRPLSSDRDILAPVIAQLGMWLGLDDWGPGRGRYYELEGAGEVKFAYLRSQSVYPPKMGFLEQPVGVFKWFEGVLCSSGEETSALRYPQLAAVAQIGSDVQIPSAIESVAKAMTARISALSDMLAATNGLTASPTETVEFLSQYNLSIEILDTFPESIAAPFKEAIARCERQPPTTWSDDLLQLVGREDLIIDARSVGMGDPPLRAGRRARDMQMACNALDHTLITQKTKEVDRHSISQLIFSEDRRLVDATIMMHFSMVQIGQCPRQPDWDEQTHFEHQRRVMHWVSVRMTALPAGDGMLHFDSQTPLLTEKYHLPGFTTSCLMQPMNHHLTIDRTGLTEEKVNWAYFHAGVSSGLHIARNVTGIDTSWIAFNKPAELTNRHAGLLLALGLGGHLRNMAKWLSFKYLTPKHTMTSVGLLLGLSASYIGTMDGLITRMLSVHITRMLPPGAAELNVSPATQTAGLMGIGFLYYNTQRRRMSEVMLSELEYMEIEDPDSGPDQLRDESYRLAAGFALGLINLAKGTNLRGLHGMQLPERLLAVAVGPRPVNAVHVFDRATAGAVVAIALVYMKTNDKSIARKIDIPDTEAQFDHVRPDVLLLRAMAKHIILWDDIIARGPNPDGSSQGWIQDNLPTCYRNRSKLVMDQMARKRTIDSTHIPLFNVFTGLAWALALKYAGTGSLTARDEILEVLKFFHALNQGADAFYFDAKLGRASLRRCMDVLALCAAIVMAGTGDLETFRYLRRMHGRTDVDTPYGSHVAAHLAIGALFLAGGTMTFGTSDLAVASLMIAFYPLFPTDVHDNRVHLQAFRHLWVFAAEARCLVIEDVDTQRPIHMDILISMKDGTERKARAPCLLPDLSSVETVRTKDARYWPVTLDFAGNAMHKEAFLRDPRVFVRKCPAKEMQDMSGIVSASLAALNNSTMIPAAGVAWHELFKLKTFESLDKGDIEGLLPAESASRVYFDGGVGGVGDRLVLGREAREGKERDEFWNLRVLFKWAERERGKEGRLRWIEEEVLEGLRGIVEERGRK